MIQRYISKMSGPLMDRIDIHIDVPAVNFKEMRSTNEPENSAKIRERVVRTRQKQLTRFSSSREKLYCTAQMSSRHIRAHCELSPDCERLLERAMTQQGLSARAYDRILKVARTIADLDDTPNLEPKHIAEAIQYRSFGSDLLDVGIDEGRDGFVQDHGSERLTTLAEPVHAPRPLRDAHAHQHASQLRAIF